MKFLLSSILLFVCFGTMLLSVGGHYSCAIGKDDWSIVGGVEPLAKEQALYLDKEISASDELLLFRTWTVVNGNEKGRIETRAFKAETTLLAVPVAGYPDASGNSIFLEFCDDSTQRISIGNGNLHERWENYLFRIPRDWLGQEIRLVAESEEGRFYIGVGTPFFVSGLGALKHSAFFHFYLLSVVLMYLLIGGFFMSSIITRYLKLRIIDSFLIFPLFLGLEGYLLFLLYAFWGISISSFLCVSLLLKVVIIIFERKYIFSNYLKQEIVQRYLFCWLGLSLLCFCLLNGQDMASEAFRANYRFSPASWSTDNQLPGLLASAILSGDLVEDIRWSIWSVSDRTQLMAGYLICPVYLANQIMNASGVGTVVAKVISISSIFIIMSWVGGVLYIVKSFLSNSSRFEFYCLLLFFSPFVFFNTVYGWPKLLAAVFSLSGFLFLNQGFSLCRRRYFILSGVSFGCALMSHSIAFFTLISIAVYLLIWSEKRKHLLNLSCAAVSFLIIVFPWVLWTSLYGSGHSPLPRMAFAGTFGFDNDNSFFQTVLHAYSNLTLQEWILMKWKALQVHFGLQVSAGSHIGYPLSGLYFRKVVFFSIVPALGFLLINPFLTRFRLFSKNENGRVFSALGIIFTIGFLLQFLLLWKFHIIHTYAYGLYLFLHIIFVASMDRMNERFFVSLFVIHALSFFLIWVISPIVDSGNINVGYISLFALCFIVLLLVARKGFASEI